MDIAALLQTVTAALLVGAGKLLLDVRTAVAVQAQQIEQHNKRIERVESRPACPHG